jgi:integrase
MIYKRDRYLILDPCGSYFVRIALPAYMRGYFSGKKNFIKSTGTRDIRQARLIRDAIAVEFSKLREQLRPQPSGTKMEQIIHELRQIGTLAKENPIPLAEDVFTCPSLLKLLELYLLQFSDKRKLTTLSKTNKAVEVLLAHLKKKDVQLKDVNRTMVTVWIDKLKMEKALQTIQNYISSLAQLWDLAKNRYHDAPQDNPWRGHGLEAKSSKVSYEVFASGELAKVYNLLDDEMKAVTLIGMYSGMRLNEICSLKSGNFKTIEGVLCYEIFQGKTNAAARIIPVHSKLNELVSTLLKRPYDGFLFYHASITDRADGKRSTWHTQRFTRAKRKALGEAGTERKVFHSLRHGVAQILDRGGVGKAKLKPVPEDRIALLMGHERGSTESFKTYSKNSASPVELSEYVELIDYPEFDA